MTDPCPDFHPDQDSLTQALLHPDTIRGYVCTAAASVGFGVPGIHICLLMRMHGSTVANHPQSPPFTDEFNSESDTVGLIVPLDTAEWMGGAVVDLSKQARNTAEGN